MDNYKKIRYDFLNKCVKFFHTNGLINEYQMKKDDGKSLYNDVLKQQCPHKRNSFFCLLVDLLAFKIITRKKQPHIILFNKNLFDAIIKDENFNITHPKTSIIVSQSYAFRKKIVENALKTDQNKCIICNVTYGSEQALFAHKLDKIHIVNDVKEKRSWKKQYSGNTDITVEYKKGAQNKTEFITCSPDSLIIPLTITNISNKSVNIEEMVVINPFEDISHNFQPFILKSNKKVQFNLVVRSSVSRSYDYPLLFMLKDSTSLAKQLFIEYYPEDYKYLQQTEPYRRCKPIIKEVDDVIIPGEYPKFDSSFKAAITLQKYPLKKAVISALNSGLHDDEEPETKRIKNILNVPNPNNCLTSTNYYEILDLLLFIEEHQMGIDIRMYDMETNKLEQTKRPDYFELKGLELSEHRPSLIVGDSVMVRETNSKTVYNAYVHEKRLDSVILNFHKSFKTSAYTKNKIFSISFTFNRNTLKLEHQAIDLVKKHNIAKYFFPSNVGTNEFHDFKVNWANPQIRNNERQQQAVKHILCNTSAPAPYLIFGPPGTGKTITIIETIKQIRKLQPEKNILVCTPSNNAANIITKRLDNCSKDELLRYLSYSYSKEDIHPDILKYCNYYDSYRDSYYHPSLEDIMSKKIVVTTLTTAGRLYNVGLPSKHFSYVFIDESGQATETQTLIALAGILSDNKNLGTLNGQIVLAGDPKQLGPITHSALAQKYGFSTSMLERFMTTLDLYQKHENNYNDNVLTKLLNNYRSHPEILKISNDKFYDNELVPVGHQLSNIAIGHEVLKNKKYPMIFHNVNGVDQREATSPSFFNIQEVITVMSYLEKLVDNKMGGRKINQTDIGIITPYRKQVQKLKSACKKKGWDKIEIGSVEQFQGQERLIIIISTVRTKPEYIKHDFKFHLGFLRNPKRFNVAITRAIALVIVVGNADLLQYDENWRAYIDACSRNNSTNGSNFNLIPMDQLVEILFNNLRIDDDINFSRGNQ